MNFFSASCFLGCLLAAGTVYLLNRSSSAVAAPVALYVAPTGRDTGAGSTTSPFATIGRAQQEVRALKQRQGGQLQQPVSVLVRGGTYYLPSPLVFTPEDSGTTENPVTYQATGDQRVVISGGRKLGAWTDANGLWRAAVPTGLKSFRSLRVSQNQAIRARTPNFDPEHPTTGGWWFSSYAGPASEPWEVGQFNRFVFNTQAIGTQLDWNVTVPATGIYTVWVRYAQHIQPEMGGHTTLRSGSDVPQPLQNLPDTGDWSRLQWSKTAFLPLKAGKQTLTWQNLKGGAVNIDAFVLTDDEQWQPNADNLAKGLSPLAAGKHRLIIQAEATTTTNRGSVVVPSKESIGFPDRIGLTPEQLASVPAEQWKNAEVNIFPNLGWTNDRMKVSGVDRESSLLLVRPGSDITTNNRFYIENVRSALDAPGEWFFDEDSHQVLYQPRASDTQQSVAVVPTSDRLLTLAGGDGGRFVENVRFQGLTFSDTDYTLGGSVDQADSAIWMQGARSCTIENCVFQNIGGYAVRLEQKSNGNSVVRCTMKGLGEGGVVMIGDTATQPFDNLIAANTISDCGRIYAHVSGVYVATGSGNKILNNSIRRMPRYGISVGSSSATSYSHNNLVAYNEITDSNLETYDTGAIETLGRDQADSGNRIEYNLIRNVVGLGVKEDGTIQTPYYTWGIYLDDWSSGVTVKGNIVDGTTLGGLCIHGGKNNVIENNMFLNGSEENISLITMEDDFMRNNVFSRNIVAFQNHAAHLWGGSSWKPNILGEVDNNLYWNGGISNLATAKNFAPIGDWATWRAAGRDTNSQIADPQIADDYHLQANSPALRMGFKPLPLDRFGPKGYSQ